MDAIIISDSGNDTLSLSSKMRFQLGGKTALIQTVKNYIDNNGTLVEPIRNNDTNWHHAPKLNGISLFVYLSQRNYEVGLIDSYFDEKGTFIQLLQKNPKAIIISTTFILNKQSLKELVDDIRMLAPDIPIICGGPFVYYSFLLYQKKGDDAEYDVTSPSNDFLFLSADNRPDIDLYIISNKGEQILDLALGAINKRKSIDTLPNTAIFSNNQYIFNSRINEGTHNEDQYLDWSICPDHLFSKKVVNMQASFGCPFNCKFCNFLKEKKSTFVKPLELLIKELAHVSQRGIQYVRFVDDNFRLGRNDMKEVCEQILAKKIYIKWMSFIRASNLKNMDINLLKKAGCIETQIGIESADEAVLSNMNKKADPKMYKKVVTKLLEAGINCTCCFVVGFPGETQDSFKRTIDFIESIPRDNQEGIFTWSIYPFFVVPLSPIYQKTERGKYHLEGYMDKWSHFSMDSDTAKQLVKEAFFTIDSCSPIYSGDNIEMLQDLSPSKRKQFMLVRHRLSKKSLKIELQPQDILSHFSDIW